MNEESNSLDDIKYGLVAITQSDEDLNAEVGTVVHFCGYTHPTTDEDIKSLGEELNADPEFHLVGRINKDVFIIRATAEMIEFYTNPGINREKYKIATHEEKE
jgi:hypothetical protein